MENYSYNTTASYAESGESSPRSRDVDFENPPPWEESNNGSNYKVKFMCSYGGKIHPRPHDNQLSYVGGETKILAVDRFVKFAVVNAKLTALCDGEVCFKYQLPGEDLDALISVTNDDDLEHMMHEYDRLNRVSPSPARLRLFLFPATGQTPALTPVHSFGSTNDGRTDRDRFMDALNSGHIQPNTPPSVPPQQPSVVIASKGRDYHNITPDPQIHISDNEISGIESDRIQKHIHDLQRLQITEQQQQQQPAGGYLKPSDDNLTYTGDYYAPKMTEKVPPATVPGAVPAPATGYQISGGGYTTSQEPQQPVYMIPSHASMYHAPMARPVTTAPVNHPGQGYYVQRMPTTTEMYRDQALYNAMQPTQQMQPQPQPQQQQQQIAAQQSTLTTQQQYLPQKVQATYPEGYRMVQSTTGMTEPGYAQVAYDNVTGRQIYYTNQAAVAAPQQPQQMQQSQTQQLQQMQQSQQQQQMQSNAQQQYQAMAGLNQENGGKVVVPANMKEFI